MKVWIKRSRNYHVCVPGECHAWYLLHGLPKKAGSWRDILDFGFDCKIFRIPLNSKICRNTPIIQYISNILYFSSIHHYSTSRPSPLKESANRIPKPIIYLIVTISSRTTQHTSYRIHCSSHHLSPIHDSLPAQPNPTANPNLPQNITTESYKSNFPHRYPSSDVPK